MFGNGVRKVPFCTTLRESCAAREKEINAATARLIKRLLKANNLSIEDLAKRTKIPLSRVKRFEAGTLAMWVGELFPLARTLGIPAEQFMKTILRKPRVRSNGAADS